MKFERKTEIVFNYILKIMSTLLQWSGKAINHFNSLGFDNKLPYTDQIFDEIIMLPLNLFISDQDVEYISNCIRGFYLR